jgi:hypothetical protein
MSEAAASLGERIYERARLTGASRLRSGAVSDALVVADLSADDPDLLPYLRYVRDASNGYVSIEVPLGSGVEVSARITTS